MCKFSSKSGGVPFQFSFFLGDLTRNDPESKNMLMKSRFKGTKIERAESFNFLGIMLDENLTWKSHIEMVGKKISKVTGILYRLKNIFPENVLFVLYNSLIVS